MLTYLYTTYFLHNIFIMRPGSTELYILTLRSKFQIEPVISTRYVNNKT